MNNSYYLTVYTPVGDWVATYEQNILESGVWLKWMDIHDWRTLLVMSADGPGERNINPCNPKYRDKLVPMWDFLINHGVLPVCPTPIWYPSATDLEKPPAELVQAIRGEITTLRGKLADIARAYPPWNSWLGSAEGGLTCVLVALYGAKQEMEKYQGQYGHNPSWLQKK